jgi:hypothetical protein
VTRATGEPRNPYSPNLLEEKLSEKGYEQRSEREFGRYTEEEIGPWVVCRATLQALSTLFGQFQKVNSRKFAVAPVQLRGASAAKERSLGRLLCVAPVVQTRKRWRCRRRPVNRN